MKLSLTCNSCSEVSKKPALEWTEEELDELKYHNVDEWSRIVKEKDEQLVNRQRQKHEKRMTKEDERLKQLHKRHEASSHIKRCKFCHKSVKDTEQVCLK